jgi:HrpA-like RNA helicase
LPCANYQDIAETSVTIDDVVVVIDSGKVNQTQYDARKQMPALVETWISSASAKQRMGRAGRVRYKYLQNTA